MHACNFQQNRIKMADCTYNKQLKVKTYMKIEDVDDRKYQMTNEKASILGQYCNFPSFNAISVTKLFIAKFFELRCFVKAY